jgi:DNA mismatch repair protein MutH
MRRHKGWLALAALALVGGCAGPSPSQDLAAGSAQGRPVAQRTGVVPCSTHGVVIATVSNCGGGAFDLGVAAE